MTVTTPDSTPQNSNQEQTLLSFIRMEKDVPCPGCHYNLSGLTVLRCPECGRVFGMGDLGFRPRPPWLSFLRGDGGALTLAAIDIALVGWVGSLKAPASPTLRMLFYGTMPSGGGTSIGGASAMMLGFLLMWFGQRVSRRPRERARAGASLLVAWGLMVVELVGVLATRLL